MTHVERGTDELILDTIHSAEDLDGLLVTDAIVIYAATPADRDGSTHYGAVYLGGSMPQHRALGLMDVCRDELLEEG